jgi:uncharacterized membrane protein YeaQ/YmgE (transglycosylase-associated protein family)
MRLEPGIPLVWVIVGLVAGLLAGNFVKGRGYGLIGDLIVGLLGAVTCGFVVGLVVHTSVGLLGSIVVAFIGAVILLYIVRQVRDGGRRRA